MMFQVTAVEVEDRLPPLGIDLQDNTGQIQWDGAARLPVATWGGPCKALLDIMYIIGV